MELTIEVQKQLKSPKLIEPEKERQPKFLMKTKPAGDGAFQEKKQEKKKGKSWRTWNY
jgi:hypothetical protein